MLNIYINGDACPVKDEIVKVASRYGLTMYMVSNQGAPGQDRMPITTSLPSAKGSIPPMTGSSNISKHWILRLRPTSGWLPAVWRRERVPSLQPGDPLRKAISVPHCPCDRSANICAKPVRSKVITQALPKRIAHNSCKR